MHTIEKEMLVARLYKECWLLYQCSVIGSNMIIAHCYNDTLPLLVMECKGIGKAGHYRPKWNGRPAAIMINIAYYDGGSTKDLETTIAHELAHHIAHCIWPQCKQWHGPEFRSVMAAIGYDGSTYHRMSVSGAKVVASRSKNELFDL